MPKQAIKAEMAVLGSCLIDPKAARKALQSLLPMDFYQDHHRQAFALLAEIYEGGGEADLILLSERLRLKDEAAFGTMGGAAYLSECVHSISSAEAVGHYCQLVKWCSLTREIENLAARLADDPDAERAMNRIGDLVLARRGLTVSNFMDLRENALEIFEKDQADQERGIPTRLTDILLFRGDILTVAARTKGGKTALMTKLALLIAELGHEVLYITTEMSLAEMLYRILPIMTGIPAMRFNDKRLTKADEKTVYSIASARFPKLGLKVWARPAPTIADIQAAAIRSKCRVLIVDYLQRCTFPALRQQDARTYQIQDFMKRLKTFSGEAGISTILGCQLNRKRDKEKGPPVLADLSDSAGVEQESVAVGLMWNPDEKDEAPHGADRSIEWITAAWRKGPSGGTTRFKFRSELVDILAATEDARTVTELRTAPELPPKSEGENWWDR